MTPQCGHCLKFCKPADGYQSWGGYGDPPEPYDPVTLCQACADAEYAKSLAMLLRRGIPEQKHGRPEYIPSRGYRRAIGVVRGMRKHGLWHPPERHEEVRSETKLGRPQVWICGNCKRPEKHPGHNADEARRTHANRCYKFVRARGYWIAPNYMRAWCACGYVTEWDRAFRAHDALRAHVIQQRQAENAA